MSSGLTDPASMASSPSFAIRGLLHGGGEVLWLVGYGALALLSVPCLLLQQQRLVRADNGASALWAIPNLLAELAAGRRTVLAHCRNISWRLGGRGCLGIIVCPWLARATAAVAGRTMVT